MDEPKIRSYYNDDGEEVRSVYDDDGSEIQIHNDEMVDIINRIDDIFDTVFTKKAFAAELVKLLPEHLICPVRCKDCVYRMHDESEVRVFCSQVWRVTPDDFFCGYGKRKED
jgi:hypothetical protein